MWGQAAAAWATPSPPTWAQSASGGQPPSVNHAVAKDPNGIWYAPAGECWCTSAGGHASQNLAVAGPAPHPPAPTPPKLTPQTTKPAHDIKIIVKLSHLTVILMS